MRLAVSNIAWTPPERLAAYAVLAEARVVGLEIAPGLIFPDEADPFEPSDAVVAAVRCELARFGLSLVSMQSLLFGVAGARLFGTSEERARFEAGIERAIRLAGRLGVPNLVFGSPANRVIPPTLSRAEAEQEAVAVFRRFGDLCRAQDCRLALEPNPAEYGTNFLTTIAEACAFAEAVDHPAITVNFDLGSLHMNNEIGDAADWFARARRLVSHVHVSEPRLAPAPRDAAGFVVIAHALADQGYDGWVSIEMRSDGAGDVARVRASVAACTAALADAAVAGRRG